MKTKRQGDWKRLAQSHAEKSAEQTARTVWLAYWKKFDRQRRLAKKSRG